MSDIKDINDTSQLNDISGETQEKHEAEFSEMADMTGISEMPELAEIKNSVYMRDLDFHVASDEEMLEIKRLQQRNKVKKWLKYVLISVLLICTFMAFQLIARKTVPHMFGRSKPASLMIRNCLFVLGVFNIISFMFLSLRDAIVFDATETMVMKLKVVKKMEIDYLGVMRVHLRYVTCNYDGHFILDRVWVRTGMDFSNIKEGQYIYVHRLHDDGHYEYYYLV